MNLNEMRIEMFNKCEVAGGISAFIRELAKRDKKRIKISHSYVAAFIRGNAKPGKKILKILGKKRVLSLDKKAEMRFEDITN